MKNQFKVGQAVVYKRENGDSVSATIISVSPAGIQVAWMMSFNRRHSEFVSVTHFERVTPFGQSLFLAL